MTAVRTAVAGREIGDGRPVFIVCEAGVTNYGELSLALEQVDAAVEAGADAVKFQVWTTEALVSARVAARVQADLGFDWFQRLKSKELSREAVHEVAAHGYYPRYMLDEHGAYFHAIVAGSTSPD